MNDTLMPPDSDAGRSPAFARKLRVRLLLTVVVLAALILASFATLQQVASRTESVSLVVNLSGRQRMLTTRVDALLTRKTGFYQRASTGELTSELSRILPLLRQVHHGLLNGSAELGLPRSQSASIAQIYASPPHRLDQRMQAYLALAADLTALPPSAIGLADLTELWDARDELVAGLDTLTGQFEVEGRTAVQQIQVLGGVIVCLLLLSLGGIWQFNFRPMELRIRGELISRRETEKALQNSRDQLAMFVEHTPAAVAMFDREMNYLVCSRRWLTDYKLVDQNLTGRNHYQVFPEISQEWKDIHKQCLEGEVMRQDEEAFQRADGSEDWVRWEVHPWRRADGSVGGLIMLTEVITERKLAEKRINLRNRAMDSAACGIVITDPARDNVVVYANPEFQRNTGRSSEQLIGRNLRFLQEDERDQADLPRLRRAIKDGQPTSVLLRNYRPDGSLFMNQLQITPVRDSAGRLVNFVGISRDIGDRLKAEQELRDSERRFRNLYSKTPVMLQSIDAQGRLAAVSDYWLARMGYLREEVIGEEITRYLSPNSRSHINRDWLRGFLRDGHCDREPLEYQTKQGEVLECELSAIAEFDDAGELRQSLAVAIDVTDRNRAEQLLRQNQKMEAIGKLTGGVAHDFNNLLAVVMGNLQLIERIDNTPERVVELANKALDATRRGARLTQQLLAFARKQPLRPEPTSPNALITGMQDLLVRTLGQAIRIETRLDAHAGRVHVDPTQLESALLNLAINARDAMPDGGVLGFRTAWLDLGPGPRTDGFPANQRDAVVIEVSDNGQGMAADVREQVFEPFFTTKERGKGTGLGLSMVYGFVQQSQGTIEVDSQSGQGSTFRIILPRLPEATVDADAPKTDDTDLPLGTGQRVLLVEDQADLREALQGMLDDLGYRVIAAEDADSALPLLTEAPYALLLTDLQMPGQHSGLDLARKASTLHPNRPVLLLSGHPGDIAQADLQRFALLQKPLSREKLARDVHAALHAASPGGVN